MLWCPLENKHPTQSQMQQKNMSTGKKLYKQENEADKVEPTSGFLRLIRDLLSKVWLEET